MIPFLEGVAWAGEASKELTESWALEMALGVVGALLSLLQAILLFEVRGLRGDVKAEGEARTSAMAHERDERQKALELQAEAVARVDKEMAVIGARLDGYMAICRFNHARGGEPKRPHVRETDTLARE